MEKIITCRLKYLVFKINENNLSNGYLFYADTKIIVFFRNFKQMIANMMRIYYPRTFSMIFSFERGTIAFEKY